MHLGLKRTGPKRVTSALPRLTSVRTHGRQTRFKRARGRTSLGAEKWLDTPLHQGTGAAVAALRAAGYRVAAAQARPAGSLWAAP